MSTEDEKELIKIKTQRLQKQKERAALMGISTPPEVLIEIDNLEVEIEKLRTKDDIRKILSLCNRRAIFTRFHAQISPEAMFESLDDCRLSLQKMAGSIETEDLQQKVAEISSNLDLIERQKQRFETSFDEDRDLINDAKLKIIIVLTELSEQVDVPYTLPKSLKEGIFFSKDEANGVWEGPI